MPATLECYVSKRFNPDETLHVFTPINCIKSQVMMWHQVLENSRLDFNKSVNEQNLTNSSTSRDECPD